MIKINLLSEGRKTAAVRRTKAGGGKGLKRENLTSTLFVVSLLFLLAAFGIYWWLLYSQLREKEAEIKRANEEIKELAPIIKEVADFKKKKAELQNKIDVITELKANQRGPVRIMDEVSKGLPELLWLGKLEMTANSVTLTGQSYSVNAIATFIENLDKVPEFQEPELIDSKRTGDLYDFSLRFGYQPVPQKTEQAEGQPAGTPEAAPKAE